jgi:hypothetical protein
MARWLLSTEIVIAVLAEGDAFRLLGARPLRDIAISAVSFEWIAADLELASLDPATRQQLRTNIVRLRELIRASGGEIPAVSLQALERWGRLQVLDLRHHYDPDKEPTRMPVEERLVVATAAASGFVYVTYARQWNAILLADLRLAIEEL